MQYNYSVLCQWQKNLQRLPLSPPGKSAVFLFRRNPISGSFLFFEGRHPYFGFAAINCRLQDNSLVGFVKKTDPDMSRHNKHRYS